MAHPKRKLSRSKRDTRRAQWYAGIKTANLSACDNCGQKKLPHRVCPNCGHYKGRSVITPKGA
ncbi:MAG: 50S ribosomal protein L32 [Caldithrix sp.]|nr:50S ribosomal protein L32 [Caldithrix sp.]